MGLVTNIKSGGAWNVRDLGNPHPHQDEIGQKVFMGIKRKKAG